MVAYTGHTACCMYIIFLLYLLYYIYILYYIYYRFPHFLGFYFQLLAFFIPTSESCMENEMKIQNTMFDNKNRTKNKRKEHEKIHTKGKRKK